MVALQVAFAHALHWLRTISAYERVRRLADNNQHDDRRFVLRFIYRSHIVARAHGQFTESTLSTEGTTPLALNS